MLSNSTGQVLKILDNEAIEDYVRPVDKSAVSTPFPLKNIKMSLFDIKNAIANSTLSFHAVLNLKKINPIKKDNHYYFKQEKNHPNSIMYVLEAACAAFYELIAPDLIPATRAVYDETTGFYVGVSSKEIPGFQSIKKRPLKKEDLFIKPEVLENFSIAEMEDLNNQADVAKVPLINREFNEILATKKISETKTIVSSAPYSLSSSIMWVMGKNAAPTIKTIITEKEINFTVQDLWAYRVRKGNGVGIPLSFFCKEADFHTDNGSYLGQRIDFDMSWWSVLFRFKQLNILERTFRGPDSYGVSQEDIVNCPVYQTTQPMYGPTQPEPSFEPVRRAISSITPVSQNSFPESQRKIYAEFRTDPIFIYHKFKTFLKCILLDRNMLLNLNKLHIKPDLKENGESLLDILTDAQDQRITSFRNILVTTPEFKEFIEKNCDEKNDNNAFASIIKEFETRNTKYKDKEKYKNAHVLINIETIKKRFEEIKLEIANKHASSIQDIDDEIDNKIIEEEFVYLEDSNSQNTSSSLKLRPM